MSLPKKKFESKIPKMPWEIKRNPSYTFSYKKKKQTAHKEKLIEAIKNLDSVVWMVNEGQNEDGTVFYTILVDGVPSPK